MQADKRVPTPADLGLPWADRTSRFNRTDTNGSVPCPMAQTYGPPAGTLTLAQGDEEDPTPRGAAPLWSALSNRGHRVSLLTTPHQ